jgi:non-homologous end joining protein Ku
MNLKALWAMKSIHALRNLGMFTQKEYAILETAVSRTIKPGTNGLTYLQWARRPRSQGGYFEDRPTVQVEEAIADMFRDFIYQQETDWWQSPVI